MARGASLPRPLPAAPWLVLLVLSGCGALLHLSLQPRPSNVTETCCLELPQLLPSQHIQPAPLQRAT